LPDSESGIIQRFLQSTRSMKTYTNTKTMVMRGQDHCGVTVSDKGMVRRRGVRCVTSLFIHCLALHRPTTAPHSLPLSIPFNALAWLPPLDGNGEGQKPL